MIEKNLELFLPESGIVHTSDFSSDYPLINNFILENQQEWDKSRDGGVKEILNFQTTLLNPYKRLVGGQYRNINIYFLLAEAMWIFTGCKDVRFLNIFNKQMKRFSDDGKVFHAPYGFRMRHWGVRSEDRFIEENMHASQGYDQIYDVIKLLSTNPSTRQAVVSIWNPDFDLGCVSKDIPCNDIVMFKVRNGKLYTTIQNRSNDLHWGLPTNIFQFGFLSEIIANILNLQLGTQTHNSQSLHIYEWNEIASRMYNEYSLGNTTTLYDNPDVKSIPIEFNFNHESPISRLCEVDVTLNRIIHNLISVSEGKSPSVDELVDLLNHSVWFHCVYGLLRIYILYKNSIADNKDEEHRVHRAEMALSEVSELLRVHDVENWDIGIMAKNFFAAKLPDLDNYCMEYKMDDIIGRL